MKTRNWGALIVGISIVIAACMGCKKDETVGESIDRNAEKAKESTKDAAEKTKDAVKDAADKTGDALKKAGEKVKDATTTNK
jgi:hypothetical protein